MIAVDKEQGDGMTFYGGNYYAEKLTVVNTKNDTTSPLVGADATAFVIRGSQAKIVNCHFEGYEYGLDVGGDLDAPVEFWVFEVEVNGFNGYNLTNQTPCKAAVRIRNNETWQFNIILRNITLNVFNSAEALVVDEVNNITIPCNANSLSLGEYYFHGDRERLVAEFGGSPSRPGTSPRPVYTSYYDYLGVGRMPVKAVTITGTTDDLDTTFGHILQLTGASTPVFTSIDNPYPGRIVAGHNISSTTIVLDHQAASGTAANRFITSTAADINLTEGDSFIAIYGDPRGASDRWYVYTV